ncbi:MAG: divergent PAP2 family protein [Firmicutes bacterium]|nr:divergent PAP2 family protein [Bacillota bacterium]
MEYLHQFFSNRIVGVAVMSWAIAQAIKMIIDFIQNKKIDMSLALSSGGMPSSHTSFVTAIMVSVGLKEGFDSTSFAICFVLSMVVMYDAAGVRRAAGRHAAILNQLIENAENFGITFDEKLKELLGHTPLQVVAGAILGTVMACAFYK